MQHWLYQLALELEERLTKDREVVRNSLRGCAIFSLLLDFTLKLHIVNMAFTFVIFNHFTEWSSG